MRPAEHFHQRALPRPILTDQRKHSPGGYTQRNIRQRLSRPEAFRDTCHCEEVMHLREIMTDVDDLTDCFSVLLESLF